MYADVDAAIAQVAREHPEVFDIGDQRGDGGYRIVQPEPFKSHLVAAAKARGMCARHDGEEFVFKRQNRFSEHYDLESSARLRAPRRRDLRLDLLPGRVLTSAGCRLTRPGT